MPVIIGLGVGMGALSAYSKQEQYQQQKKVAAATQRYSPWTGMHADTPTDPGIVGPALMGGMQGASMGAGFENAAAMQNLAKAQTSWYNQGYNPMGGAWGGSTYNPAAASMSSFNASNGMWGLGSMGPLSGMDYSKAGDAFWNQNPWGP